MDNNENYKATVVRIKEISDHPNADRLKLTNIFGNIVIIGLDTKIGDLGLYFPLESQIGIEFAQANDLLRRKDSTGKIVGGLFDENRRVRAQKLRGTPSMGFYAPISYLNEITDTKDIKEGDVIGQIGNLLISQKYVVKTVSKDPKEAKVRKKESKYIGTHFKEHFNTQQLLKNLDKIPSNALTIVTWKDHGTSIRIGNVLVNKKLTIFDKLLKKLGFNIEDKQYEMVYGSRQVIKDSTKLNQNHYYKTDLWTEVGKTFDGKLHKGEQIYGEVIGYVPNSSKLIQAGYPYGHKEGEYTLEVYRITQTNIDGISIDLSWEQVKQRCIELLVKPVDEIYTKIGPSQQDTYKLHLEGNSRLDKSHPEEGICVRVEGLTPTIYKLKSFRFLEYETKQLDDQIIDIESQESVIQEYDVLETIN